MSFRGETKNTFNHFKGLPVAKTCLRPEIAPLNTKVRAFHESISCFMKCP